jgi:hypothetical protein
MLEGQGLGESTHQTNDLAALPWLGEGGMLGADIGAKRNK